MPHEKVMDCTNHTRDENNLPVAGEQRLGIVSWSTGPTLPDDYSDPSGWVQLMTKDNAEPARFEATEDEATARLADLLTTYRFESEEGRGTMSEAQVLALAKHLAPHVRHAFGEPVGGFAITLDRWGLNRMIRLLQRARGLAYGSDA